MSQPLKPCKNRIRLNTSSERCSLFRAFGGICFNKLIPVRRAIRSTCFLTTITESYAGDSCFTIFICILLSPFKYQVGYFKFIFLICFAQLSKSWIYQIGILVIFRSLCTLYLLPSRVIHRKWWPNFANNSYVRTEFIFRIQVLRPVL